MRNLTIPLPAVLWLALPATCLAAVQATERASVDSSGTEADGPTYGRPSLDHAGRVVAFHSEATNLAANDTNGSSDVFLRDQDAGTTILVSANPSGLPASGTSEDPHVAALGRYVAFTSDAEDITPGDSNGTFDIFLRDTVGATTTLVSRAFGGGASDGASFHPFVSADGRYVAFASDATDLVQGDTNGARDVFLADVATGITVCLSADSAGLVAANGPSDEPSISADGLWAAFHSDAYNLVAGDADLRSDVFLRDVAAGVTTRVTLAPDGDAADDESYNPCISEDGLFVAYESLAENLIAHDDNYVEDVFVYDVALARNTLVSRSTAGDLGDLDSFMPVISSTGRWVVYSSAATNLVAGDANLLTDAFVTDRLLQVTHRVSLCDGLVESAGASLLAAISGDGQSCAWNSASDDFVLDDTNGVEDMFVRSIAPAAWANYGSGFPGSGNLVPTIGLTADPVIGTTTTLEIGNSNPSATIGLLVVGFEEASIPTNKGGDLLVDPARFVPLSLPPGQLDLLLAIPAEDRLEGFPVFLQALELDPGAAYGVSFTAGLELTCGW